MNICKSRITVSHYIFARCEGKIQRFEEALERLNNKMLLCGYRYYPEVCSEIAGMFEEGMRIGR